MVVQSATMFDQLKNLGQLSAVMKNAGKIRDQFEEAQAHLKTVRVDAETGGGAVKAVATGDLRLASIAIDPAMFAVLVDANRPEDRRLAEDLIVGAVNAALEKARRYAADDLTRRAQDLGLPTGGLGGMDMSRMLGGA